MLKITKYCVIRFQKFKHISKRKEVISFHQLLLCKYSEKGAKPCNQKSQRNTAQWISNSHAETETPLLCHQIFEKLVRVALLSYLFIRMPALHARVSLKNKINVEFLPFPLRLLMCKFKIHIKKKEIGWKILSLNCYWQTLYINMSLTELSIQKQTVSVFGKC